MNNTVNVSRSSEIASLLSGVKVLTRACNQTVKCFYYM